MSWEKTSILLGQIKGFMQTECAEWLYRSAAGLPMDPVVLEIGAFCGHTTVAIACGLRDAAHNAPLFFTVDPFDQPGLDKVVDGNYLDVFFRNMRKFGLLGLVHPIVSTSFVVSQIWSKPLDLLFIDGKHKRPYPSMDVLGFWKHLKPGGWLAMHDVGEGWEAVIEAWEMAEPHLDDVDHIGPLAVGRKKHGDHSLHADVPG